MGWFRKINKNGEDYKPIGNVITATSLSVTGPDLADGDVVRVMFTTDIAGSDTSTPLALTWNGGATPIPVKASKEGSLASIYAFEYATNLYRYISAYVTLELAYDGTNQQFVVIGNPVILSGSDYAIYADGQIADQTPVGVITAYYGTSDPFGWLICDGRTNLDLQHKYPKLYAFLGNSNGLPDLRECTVKGIGQTPYATHGHFSGLTIGGFVNDRIIRHTHLVDLPLNFAGSGSKIYYLTNTGAGITSGANTTNVQEGWRGDTNEVKAIGVNFIIKAM